MSTAQANARPPAASISAAAVWIVPSSAGCGSVVFAATTMLAPSAAARRAIALPIPRLAPVMNSVFPRSEGIGRLPRGTSGGARSLVLQDVAERVGESLGKLVGRGVRHGPHAL